MALSTQPYKGTRDFYPDDMRLQQWMFSHLRETAESFAYQEYDGPILEPFELYAAKSGEELVSQQLYHFMDRGERKLAIRPEMTPTLARMVAAKIQELPKPVRWYCISNFYRYERPQRGRLREFYQLNCDVLGGDPIQADAEILVLALDLIKAFGGEKFVSVKVNHRALIDEFFTQGLGLAAEQTQKLIKLIDARPKMGEEKFMASAAELGLDVAQIQKLDRFFTGKLEDIAREYPGRGSQELTALFALLKESGVGDQIVFDPLIMRGLDYYTGTVFEVFDISPENNRAMFGGGRYDNLVGLFGNHKLSGVGFGMGDVTLKNFLETHQLIPTLESTVDVLVAWPKAEFRGAAEKIARELRFRKLRVMTPLQFGGFGDQIKLALKHGARFAVLFGDAELARGTALVKDLQKQIQTEVALGDVAAVIEREHPRSGQTRIAGST